MTVRGGEPAELRRAGGKAGLMHWREQAGYSPFSPGGSSPEAHCGGLSPATAGLRARPDPGVAVYLAGLLDVKQRGIEVERDSAAGKVLTPKALPNHANCVSTNLTSRPSA